MPHELAEMATLTGKRERELTMVFESSVLNISILSMLIMSFDVRFFLIPLGSQITPNDGVRSSSRSLPRSPYRSVHNFIYQTRSYLELWLPMLETSNRSYLTVAIGCTGGKHRSVYVAEQLADYFRSRGKNVQSRQYRTP